MKQHKNRISPYIYGMFVIGSVMMIGMCIQCFYFLKGSWNTRETGEQIFFVLWISAPTVGWFVVTCSAGAYLFLGTYHFEPNTIVVRAFLRKEIRISFDDIKDIGIDYIVVNASYQFWIYVSKEIVPISFLNGNIKKLPFSTTSIKMQYSPQAMAEFMRALPPDLKKQLQRSENFIQRLS